MANQAIVGIHFGKRSKKCLSRIYRVKACILFWFALFLVGTNTFFWRESKNKRFLFFLKLKFGFFLEIEFGLIFDRLKIPFHVEFFLILFWLYFFKGFMFITVFFHLFLECPQFIFFNLIKHFMWEESLISHYFFCQLFIFLRHVIEKHGLPDNSSFIFMNG